MGQSRWPHDIPLREPHPIHLVDPNALMAGTDLPSTRAKRKFSIDDLNLIADNFGEDAELILYKNAQTFYRLQAR